MTEPAMTVEFPAPAKRISMNDRLHWRARARLTRTWRQRGHAAALEQLGAGPSARRRGACFVRVEFPVRDLRRRDPHNQAPTIKAIIDGLVDAGVWPDDTDEFVTVLDPRFYKPTGPLAAAPVIVTLIPRAGELPACSTPQVPSPSRNGLGPGRCR